jgi:nicotinamidase-related amidase
MLKREDAALVLVDMQEAFREVVPEFDVIVRRCGQLVRAARILGLPICVTEQYPRGLGPTVAELAELIEDVPRRPKLAFSASRAEGFDLEGRGQAILCGIETHICVSQTALDLGRDGVDVYVAADAVGSRHVGDHDLGLRRIESFGGMITATEGAVFELLGSAADPEFKAIQRVILA